MYWSWDPAPLQGWPATDWVEDMMLRTQLALTDYDAWVTNEIEVHRPQSPCGHGGIRSFRTKQ